MTAQYYAPPPSALRVVALDALTAIFHRPSCQTHIVAPPVPEILALLAEGPMDDATLLARLHDTYDLADGDAAALRARLDELVAIGLIERR